MKSELDRYHRQMLLPGIGQAGQQKLLDSTVLIVGCGALGTVIANTLGRAGVGHLVIVDRDFIEVTNLQRQVLFDESDIEQGLPKAEAAKQKLERINSKIRITSIVDDVNHANIERLSGMDNPEYGRVDLLIDGVDNFETRFVINDAAVKLGIPYVYGGAVGTVGMTYTILPHTHNKDAPWECVGRATPCLRCIFEQTPPPGMNPTCDTAGVLGSTVSIVASYQSNEAVKVLTSNWESINPTMLSIDTWHNTINQFKVAAAYDLGQCVCCKKRNFEFLGGQLSSSTTTLCGRNAVQLTCQGGGRLDFEEIAGRLKMHGAVKANRFMLHAEVRDNGQLYELTVFTDGRAIVKGTKEPNTAKSIYAKYVGN